MSGKAVEIGKLADAVRATPPDEFARLSAEDLATLTAVVERAAADRDTLIDRAIEDSLRHMPALLRGPVKRALGL